jgi:hypothetical protein
MKPISQASWWQLILFTLVCLIIGIVIGVIYA